MYPKFFTLSRRTPSILTLLLVSFLLFVLLCGDVASGAAVDLRERQVDGTDGVAETGTTVAPGTTRTGASTAVITTTTTFSRSSGAEETDEPTMDVSSSSTRGPAPTLINNADSDEIDPDIIPIYSGVGLPIIPKVTPGIGVAGVLLMLAGLPLCLIGIKQKKVQIFLSVAYLCSLGVTVLVVYVMNPPVKDTIQGAYVVAATITGFFFGAIAVIFPEVTEKLGCLLGGFCLSMWFLVLKPGGLIDNTYGKLIMIAAFSLTIFLLAFHRITKPYAIISACSFSGATSVVLGIDCFSRAGLKEFWLYIWALNDSIFPLNTYTYPHTRGMRVEIAIILLITAFGIMSQMKLWKILRERRDQKRAEKLKEQNDVERLDEDVGRRVEEEDRRERAEWEKIYGNADSADKDARPDSGVGSRIGSGVTLMENDEIKEVPGSVGKEPMGKELMGKEGDTHIQVASIPVEGENVETEAENPVIESVQTVATTSEAPTAGAANGLELAPIEEESESSLQVEANSPPPPPPPILVRHLTPYIPDEEDREDDAMSVATYADTISHTVHLQDLNKNYEINIKTVDVNAVDTFEKTPDNNVSSKGELGHTTEPGLNHDSVVKAEQPEFQNRENSSVGETVIATTEPRGEVTGAKTEETGGVSARTQPIEEHKTTTEEPKVASTISGEPKISSVISGEKTSSSPASLADLDTLQNHCSRIHKTYRTNEWAKHLADAEAVELDDLSPYLEEGVPEEVPVPVLVDQLQESPMERKPKLPKSRLYQEHPSRDPTPISFAVTATIPHVAPVPAPLPTPAPTPTPTATPPPPVATAVPLKPILKPSSTPTIPEVEGAVVDKPVISHRASLPPPARAMSPTPAIPYENTLIGRRESFLKLRPSMLMNQEQMIRAASPIGYQNSIMVGDTASVHNMSVGRMTPINMEDMTLSQRREYLRTQMQQAGSPVQSRSGTPMPQLSPRNSFGPPSPTIGAAAKQNQLLQSWRESLKQDSQISHQSPTTWGERKALEALNEKQQAAIFKKEKEVEKVQRDAIVNERMRSPDMLSAHREAMRRLQAGASTH